MGRSKKKTPKPRKPVRQSAAAKTVARKKLVAASASAKKGLSDVAGKVKASTVEGYVRGLPSPQATIVNRLRALVREAAPEAVETMKWAQPVFEANGPFAHIKAQGKSVNFGFWRGTLLNDPDDKLVGDGEKMRHLKISTLKDIRSDVIRALVRGAVLLNRHLGDPTRG